MKHLPKPTDKLAGCVWFARIIFKVRLLTARELPDEFAARFAHPTGTDNQFLSFFKLTKEDILSVCTKADKEVEDWFLSDEYLRSRVEEWNTLALNLGSPGFPMEQRLPIALQTTYSHLQGQNLQTVFEMLQADDALSEGTES